MFSLPGKKTIRGALLNKLMWKQFVILGVGFSICAATIAQTRSGMKTNSALPAGYWPAEKSQSIIDKTQTIRLAPDISQLGANERKAVEKLLEVGKIFQTLYEQQRHPEAIAAYRKLLTLDKSFGSATATQNLLTLYRLNQGPIATTLENKREPFLPVEGIRPGKSVYPWGVKKEEIECVPCRASGQAGYHSWICGRLCVGRQLKTSHATWRSWSSIPSSTLCIPD